MPASSSDVRCPLIESSNLTNGLTSSLEILGGGGGAGLLARTSATFLSDVVCVFTAGYCNGGNSRFARLVEGFPCTLALEPDSLSDRLGELLALDGGVLNGDTRSSEDVAGAASATDDPGPAFFGSNDGLLPIFGFDALVGTGGAIPGKSCIVWRVGVGGGLRTNIAFGTEALRSTSCSSTITGAGRTGLVDGTGGAEGGGGGHFSWFGEGVFPRLGAPLKREFELGLGEGSRASIFSGPGDLGDSTRNVGGTRGGGENVLCIDSGRWRELWPLFRGRERYSR